MQKQMGRSRLYLFFYFWWGCGGLVCVPVIRASTSLPQGKIPPYRGNLKLHPITPALPPATSNEKYQLIMLK